MKKYLRYESIFNSIFKDIPACILGISLIFSLIYAANSYTGVRGTTLNTLFIIIGVVFFEILLIIVYKRIMNSNEKSINIIIAIEFIALCAGLIAAGYFIQSNDLYDFEYMHMAAMSYADNGSWGHSWYFSRYPKQRSWTVFLGFVYKLEKTLGITDYRIGGIAVGIVLTFIMVYFSAKIVEMLLDNKRVKAISLLFLVLNPTFYLFVSFYYKYTPGAMCEVLVLYLVLKGGEKGSSKYYIIAGIIAGIGCFILKSVGIGVIAAGIYIIFSNEPNKIKKIVIVGGSFVGGGMSIEMRN